MPSSRMTAAGMERAFERALRRQNFMSMHPTGVPLYIETWKRARGWNMYQKENGLGNYEVVVRNEDINAADAANFQMSRHVFNGESMCKLSSSGVANGYTYLWRSYSMLPSQRLGIEVNLAIPYERTTINDICDYIQILVAKSEKGSTARHEAGVRLDLHNDYLLFWDGESTHSLISGNLFTSQYLLSPGYLSWINIKVIVDFDNLTGVKAYFNDREWDLSDYSLAETSSGYTQGSDLFRIDLNSSTLGTQFHIYLGNVILTMEE